MQVWYRCRLYCNLDKVSWSEVRSHQFARAIVDYVSSGIPTATFSPVIFDPRFFPFQFSEPQSILTAKETRSLLFWALSRWPDWSIAEFNPKPITRWLEVLNPADKQKTLEILGEYYGLGK